MTNPWSSSVRHAQLGHLGVRRTSIPNHVRPPRSVPGRPNDVYCVNRKSLATSPSKEHATTAAAWSPSSRELDDLESLLLGAYLPLRGFLGSSDRAAVSTDGRLGDGTPWPVPVDLKVPRLVADQAAAAGLLVLLDEEGARIGAVRVTDTWAVDDEFSGVAGPVEPLAGSERGSFRRLRRPAAASGGHERLLGVPVEQPLFAPHIAQLGAAARALGSEIRLLPLTGAGRAAGGLDGPALVRTCLAAAEMLGADVVPVPVPRRGDPDRDRLLLALVARAYGATHVPGPLPESAGPLPIPVDLPTVVRDLRTGSWEPLDAVPIEDRGSELAEDVCAEVERRVRCGGAVPSWMTGAAVVRELQRGRRDRPGFTVLLTGLSGSGKSTIARALQASLLDLTERAITLLDGDVVRRMLSSELSFSQSDRELNVRRIGWVAAEVTRHGGIALCAPIAPYASMRAEVREMVSPHGGFLLVHVATSLEVCESRDRKGLYAKARAGGISAFTGISDPYETPIDADVVIDAALVPVEEAVGAILAALTDRGCVDLDVPKRGD